MEITKEDIDRNFRLLKEDKPLDMPLFFLNGQLKSKVNSEAYREANKDKIAKRKKKEYQRRKAGDYVLVLADTHNSCLNSLKRAETRNIMRN